MGDVVNIAKSIFADGPIDQPTHPDKSRIRNEFAPAIERTAAGAAAGLVRAWDWAGLQLIAGTRDGQPGIVEGGDFGSHADTIGGGTIPNRGNYAWVSSVSKWRWISALADFAADIQGLTTRVDAETSARVSGDAKIPDIANQRGTRDRIVNGTRTSDKFFDDYGASFPSWYIGVNPYRFVQNPSAIAWWLLFSEEPAEISHRVISRSILVGNGPGGFSRPGTLVEDIEVQPTIWYKASDVLKNPEKFDLHQHARLPANTFGPMRNDTIYWSMISARNSAGQAINIGVAKGRGKVNEVIDPIWKRGLFSSSLTSGGTVPTDDRMVAIAIYEAIYDAKAGRGMSVDMELVAVNGDIALNQAVSGSSSAWTVSTPPVSIDVQPAPIQEDHFGSKLIGIDKVSAAGRVRYDVVFIAPSDGALLVSKGTERAVEANEYRPSVKGFGKFLTACAHDKGVELIRTCDFDGFVRRGAEGRHFMWLEYCRQRLPKTMRKLRRGLPIRYAWYGDSIGAIGGGNGTPYEPNGQNRDILSYLSSYSSDALAMVATTPGEDPAQPHVKIGSDWYVMAAMQDRWGSLVEPLNMCVAGTNSSNSVTENIGPNGLYPQRLAALIALMPDFVHLRFGMNEIPDNNTFTNLVSIITQLQAAGIEVIVSTCPLPRSTLAPVDWWIEQTKQNVRAAQFTDSAFVDLSRIFGPGNEGAVGISSRTVCDANQYNHPGVYELRKFGEYMSLIFA